MSSKNQSASFVVVLFTIQNVFLPFGVQAQQVATAAPAYFNELKSPDFTSLSGPLQVNLQSCLIKSGLGMTGDLVKDQATAQNRADYWRDKFKKKGDDKDQSPTGCKCEDPAITEAPSCGKYGIEAKITEGNSQAPERKPNQGQISKHFDDRKIVTEHIACLKNLSKCGNEDLDKVKKQVAAYNCQMQALQAAVQQAGQLLKPALDNNLKTYQQMNIYTDSVDKQVEKIDEVLMGDPKLGGSGDARFKGLIGLNNELKQSLTQMKELEASAKTEIDTIDNDETSNNDLLEASRTQQAWSCFNGTTEVGGKALTCFQPTMDQSGGPDKAQPMRDRNGNMKTAQSACGALNYIQSKLAQSAYVNNGKGILRNANNANKANQYANDFNSRIVIPLMGMMAASSPGGAGQGEGGASGAMVPTVKSWQDIESKFGGAINEISAESKINVRQLLQSTAAKCFIQADQYKNTQLKSASSQFNKNKLQIENKRKVLTSKINDQITKAGSAYTDIIAVLSGGKQHSVLNMAQCPKNDAKKMINQGCLNSVMTTVEKLQTGEKGATAIPIQGGSLTMNVACTGLTGCITAMQSARVERKAHSDMAKALKTQKVTESNSAITNNLNTLGKVLSQGQNGIKAMYDEMKKSMLALGITAPDSLNFGEKEALSPLETKDGSVGPYQQPKDLTALLSGSVLPEGLYSFKDSGMKDILKEINDKEKEKKADIKEKLKDFQSILAKYDGIAGECNVKGLSEKGDDSNNEENVGVMETDCRTCASGVRTCQGALKGGSDKIAGLQKEIDDLNAQIKTKTNRSNAVIDADIKSSKASIKTLKNKPNKTTEEQKQLTDEEAKLVTLEKEKNENKDAALVKKKSDEIKELKAQIVKKEEDIKTLESEPSSSLSSSDNMASLQALLDAVSKLKKNEDVEKNHKTAEGNLDVLDSLNSEKKCENLYNGCEKCTSSAKKVYTEAEKKDGDGGSSNKGQ